MDLFPRFEYFNPIQTQIFFNLFHTDENVLLGAPTGSGKTIAAEFAMFRVFNEYPKGKVGHVSGGLSPFLGGRAMDVVTTAQYSKTERCRCRSVLMFSRVGFGVGVGVGACADHLHRTTEGPGS